MDDRRLAVRLSHFQPETLPALLDRQDVLDSSAPPPEGYMHYAGIGAFVAAMEAFRGDAPGINETLWQRVLGNADLRLGMARLREVRNEMDLRDGFATWRKSETCSEV